MNTVNRRTRGGVEWHGEHRNAATLQPLHHIRRVACTHEPCFNSTGGGDATRRTAHDRISDVARPATRETVT